MPADYIVDTKELRRDMAGREGSRWGVVRVLREEMARLRKVWEDWSG